MPTRSNVLGICPVTNTRQRLPAKQRAQPPHRRPTASRPDKAALESRPERSRSSSGLRRRHRRRPGHRQTLPSRWYRTYPRAPHSTPSARTGACAAARHCAGTLGRNRANPQRPHLALDALPHTRHGGTDWGSPAATAADCAATSTTRPLTQVTHLNFLERIWFLLKQLASLSSKHARHFTISRFSRLRFEDVGRAPVQLCHVRGDSSVAAGILRGERHALFSLFVSAVVARPCEHGCGAASRTAVRVAAVALCHQQRVPPDACESCLCVYFHGCAAHSPLLLTPVGGGPRHGGAAALSVAAGYERCSSVGESRVRPVGSQRSLLFLSVARVSSCAAGSVARVAPRTRAVPLAVGLCGVCLRGRCGSLLRSATLCGPRSPIWTLVSQRGASGALCGQMRRTAYGLIISAGHCRHFGGWLSGQRGGSGDGAKSQEAPVQDKARLMPFTV